MNSSVLQAIRWHIPVKMDAEYILSVCVRVDMSWMPLRNREDWQSMAWAIRRVTAKMQTVPWSSPWVLLISRMIHHLGELLSREIWKVKPGSLEKAGSLFSFLGISEKIRQVQPSVRWHRRWKVDLSFPMSVLFFLRQSGIPSRRACLPSAESFPDLTVKMHFWVELRAELLLRWGLSAAKKDYLI